MNRRLKILAVILISALYGTAHAEVSTVNITSTNKMTNSIDNASKKLRVRYDGSVRSSEYCYIALDQASSRNWNRMQSRYSCEISIPYSIIDTYNGPTYGFRVLVFIGKYGSQPTQKGWTSFKSVSR